MKSSSGLFPALLVAAELKGQYVEDVYRLKPGNGFDRQVEFAITHLSSARACKAGWPPMMLLHGLYRNRQQWLEGGKGLALALVDQGVDVWLPEWREHGASPLRPQARATEPRDMAETDLAAMALFVREQTGRAAIWLGIDAASLAILHALQGGHLPEGALAGFISLGDPLARTELGTGQRAREAGLSRGFAQEIGGDEPERKQWLDCWRSQFGLVSRWRQRLAEPLVQHLQGNGCPLLIVAPEAQTERWQPFDRVQLAPLATGDEPAAPMRSWLRQPESVALLLPLVLHWVTNLKSL